MILWGEEETEGGGVLGKNFQNDFTKPKYELQCLYQRNRHSQIEKRIEKAKILVSSIQKFQENYFKLFLLIPFFTAPAAFSHDDATYTPQTVSFTLLGRYGSFDDK